MRQWLFLLGGLTLWAVHFFALYAIGSIYPGQAKARDMVLLVTLAAFLPGLLLLRAAWLELDGGQETNRPHILLVRASALGTFLALISIAWQALPAIIL